MTVTVGSIQSWVTSVGSTMATLPAQLEEAAPQGAFAHVLAQAAAVLDGMPATPATGGAATATGPGLSGFEGGVLQGGGLGSGGLGVLQGGELQGAALQGAATGSMSPTSLPVTTIGTASGAGVVAEAQKFLGVPYVWGGESPSGFDCSGLVQYVYSQLGISLPRTSEEQALVGTPVANLAQAEPGDLVFFAGSDGTPTAPGHVGIYIGNGTMIDAPYTGADVQVQTVSAAEPVVAIRRVIPTTGFGYGAARGGSTSSVRFGSAQGAASATPTSTGPIAVPANLAPLFLSAGAKYGVSPTLLAAIARQESGFTPSAVSTAGAQGLMQIMPGTAGGLGITPFTPAQAIDGAARLISGYAKQFGSLPLALAAYSAGAGAVEEYGGIPPYAQTQDYVSAIMKTIGASV